MQYEITRLLECLRPLFSRQASFFWFVVVIFGFLLRFDLYGVSSFVRWLHLPTNSYNSLLQVFYSNAWSLGDVMLEWMQVCQSNMKLVYLQDRLLVLGDQIKVPKEAKCQPGLTYLHNASNNQSKPNAFVGHCLGCLAFVAQGGNPLVHRAVLQAAQVHDGLDPATEKACHNTVSKPAQSGVIRMIAMATAVAMHMNQPICLVLDAWFATTTLFQYVFSHCRADGTPWTHVITRAKDNYVAYLQWLAAKASRKDRKACRVKLWDVFAEMSLFNECPHPLHPKRTVKLYQRDLYWNGFLLRFVWVIDGWDGKFILMSSNRQLTGLEILKAYGLRSTIEAAFRTLKHLLAGFGYRFWTTACQVRYTANALVNQGRDTIVERKVATLNAIERYINLAIIAQDILTYLAIIKPAEIWVIHRNSSWLRSYSSPIPSEETVQRALQSQLLTLFTLSLLKSWLDRYQVLALPDKTRKVKRDATLPYFLSS